MSIRDTELYDEDTDTIYGQDPYDARCYCKHGNYVGTPGGPDIMCGACEMGDPDPTINDYKSNIQRATQKLTEGWQILNKFGHGFTNNATLIESVMRHHMSDPLRRIGNYLRVINNIRPYVDSDDDDNYLQRMQDMEMEEV